MFSETGTWCLPTLKKMRGHRAFKHTFRLYLILSLIFVMILCIKLFNILNEFLFSDILLNFARAFLGSLLSLTIR